MRIGAHESVAGGLFLAFERAQADGCEAMQIFTRNSNQWNAKPLAPDEITAFQKGAKAAKIPVLVHDSYLINLGGKGEVLDKSIVAFRLEIERCDTLGIKFLVMHPGAHLGDGEPEGIARIARQIQAAVDATKGAKVRILIENTAGQGSHVGYRFEHLAELLGGIDRGARTGICFDTQHAWAAGYDLASEDGYESTWADFDRLVGLKHLHAFHLNDSKKPRGERVDRHEWIGKGLLGIDCFRRLVNDKRFAEIPAVLETPPGEDGAMPYREEIAMLRKLKA